MDDILAKNLTNIFLNIKEEFSNLEENSNEYNSFNSYDEVKKSFFVKTNDDFIEELNEKDKTITLDFFDDIKNIIKQNEIYVNEREINLLEQKEEFIKEDFLNKLSNIFKNADILPTQKPEVKPKVKKQQKIKSTEDTKEISKIPVENPVEISLDTPIISPEQTKKEEIVPPASVIDAYNIKTPESETKTPIPQTFVANEGEDTAKSIEALFFDLLEGRKNDKRFTRFFNSQIESVKKELFAITEKYTREIKMTAEGGGGTNAVQYANGGTMNGNLSVNGNLTVTGTINGGSGGSGSSLQKKTFIVGDGSNSSFILSHSLNTKEIIISTYDINTEELVLCSIKNLDGNETQISFGFVPSYNSIRVVLVG